ncbi:MAG: heme biosynthesis HemY N-terminal domain-containing protein [Rhizomicrobium sp.]
MIRLLGILVAAGLLAAGIAWIADRQGELVFTLDAYEIHMSAAATIGFAVLFTALVVVLARLITTLVTGPGAIGAWFSARRLRRGNDSLSRGLLAVAAGDIHDARRHAERARGILGTHPLALLLQSQAALLDGDGTAQRHAYRAMLHHEAHRIPRPARSLPAGGGREQSGAGAAIRRAGAHFAPPRAVGRQCPVRVESRARRLGRGAQGAGGRRPAQNAGKRCRAPPPRRAADRRSAGGRPPRRRRQRPDAGERGAGAGAGARARGGAGGAQAGAGGKAWRAQGVVEACWTQAPHPDLAEVYAAIKPDETYAQRAARLVGLAHLNREHFESRVLEARKRC